jgi:hypothetical protein
VRAIFGHLVNVFETDPRWLWRVLAAGGCGLVIAVGVILQDGAKLGSSEIICMLIMLPTFSLVAGCLLATIDTVRKRVGQSAVARSLRWLVVGVGVDCRAFRRWISVGNIDRQSNMAALSDGLMRRCS